MKIEEFRRTNTNDKNFSSSSALNTKIQNLNLNLNSNSKNFRRSWPNLNERSNSPSTSTKKFSKKFSEPLTFLNSNLKPNFLPTTAVASTSMRTPDVEENLPSSSQVAGPGPGPGRRSVNFYISLSTDDQGPNSNGPGNSHVTHPHGNRIFTTTAVQTEEPNWESSLAHQESVNPESVVNFALDNSFVNQSQQSTGVAQSPRNRCWPKCCCIDCTTAFYALIATMMIAVGVTVILVTSLEHWYGQDPNGNNLAAAQLWIIGPIFICSGGLVCVKLISRIYRIVQRRRRGPNFDAEQPRTLSILPPSYSRALNARIPSNVVVQESVVEIKSTRTQDENNTTELNAENSTPVSPSVDAPPPSYSQAIVMLKEHEISRNGSQVRHIGVQSDGIATSSTSMGHLPPVDDTTIANWANSSSQTRPRSRSTGARDLAL